jgi:hypothetical protein
MRSLKSVPPKRGKYLKDIVYEVRAIMCRAAPEEIEFARGTDVDSFKVFADYLLENGLAPSVDIVVQAVLASDYNAFMREIMRLKQIYGIPRPFTLAWLHREDFPFEHNSQTATSASYPSGHAAESRFFAHHLSEHFLRGHPDADLHRSNLFSLANQIAWGRVVLGVHSIQDIREGARLADSLFI